MGPRLQDSGREGVQKHSAVSGAAQNRDEGARMGPRLQNSLGRGDEAQDGEGWDAPQEWDLEGGWSVESGTGWHWGGERWDRMSR